MVALIGNNDNVYLFRYSFATGSVSEIETLGAGVTSSGILGGPPYIHMYTGYLYLAIGTQVYYLDPTGLQGSVKSSGNLESSRFDLGTNALKLFREIEIEHLNIPDEASDASIEVKYRIDMQPTVADSGGNAYTSAGTSTVATKGKIITLSQTGRTMQLKTVLTKGTTHVPILTGVTVRAIPLRNAKREFTLLLNLQKGSLGPRGYAGDTVTSATKRSNLHTILTAQAALTLTDPTGATYTCLPSSRVSPLEYNPVIESADGTKRKLETVGKLVLEEI